ncbi:MAG: U32 family peptidase [archaeon]|nr:U32 family peptidase [archaeon]
MVELLIPAQNKKSVQASIGKADAIYFGTETFNMRAHARNIKKADLKDFIKFCHDNGINAYMTTNILIYEGEIGLLRNLIEEAYSAEVDALIVHDFASINLAKEFKMPFHISTQASVSNSVSAQFYENLGAERIIMARELSLKQIAEIVPKMKTAKIEAFIHGAMCTSISGRCYFSQTICDSSEFSANRGKCLQPCRKQWRVLYQDGQEFDYDGDFFINAKDLCMIEYMPELIEAGIFSFKIEGRMRSARYIETVSRIYREAIDAYNAKSYSKEKALEWKKELEQVYNRGFSTGFYFRKPTGLDVNQKATGNMASSRKTEVGKVITYYRDKMIAKIGFRTGQFKPGDLIYFEGGDLGTFYKHNISEMYHKNKLILETPDIAGLKDDYIITVKVDMPVRKNDRVFIYI